MSYDHAESVPTGPQALDRNLRDCNCIRIGAESKAQPNSVSTSRKGPGLSTPV
jgi:hypothetical protein